MSNSGRRAAEYICVCLFCQHACMHILVFAHNLNQYVQEGGIKATNQLQEGWWADVAERKPYVLKCSVNSTVFFNQCNKHLFQTLVSFSHPPGTRFLFSVCLLGDHQSEAFFPRCPSFIILGFFCLPMRAFRLDLCALGKDRCG